jgi:hypothetical protein
MRTAWTAVFWIRLLHPLTSIPFPFSLKHGSPSPNLHPGFQEKISFMFRHVNLREEVVLVVAFTFTQPHHLKLLFSPPLTIILLSSFLLSLS